MRVTPIKTPIVQSGDDLTSIIANALTAIPEKSVLVVASKIVALSEKRVVPIGSISKHELVKQEAELFTDPQESPYHMMLTIKEGMLGVNAGIDESNVSGVYVLLPKDSYASAEKIWLFLREYFQVREVGVVITDSLSLPLKWGTVGRSLAYCGFVPVKDMIGQPDLFGRPLKVTKMNITEGIAAAAVLEMGEAAESTPLCLIEAVKHIEFVDHPPTDLEKKELLITLAEDIYGPIINSPQWLRKEK